MPLGKKKREMQKNSVVNSQVGGGERAGEKMELKHIKSCNLAIFLLVSQFPLLQFILLSMSILKMRSAI